MRRAGSAASWRGSGRRGGASSMLLDLVLQISPCRVEPVGRLLRAEAIRRAGGERDGTRQFWWVEARNLRALADELRRASDPLFHAADG